MADRIPPNKKGFSWGRLSKTVSFWILLILIPIAFIQLSAGRADQAVQVTYTQYDQELARDNVSKVTIQGGKQITGEFKARVLVNWREVKKFSTRLPVADSADDVKRLREKGVQI